MRLLHPNVAGPTPATKYSSKRRRLASCRKAVDAGFFAFVWPNRRLVDEDLDQDFQVALLPCDRLDELLQFLLCGMALPNFGLLADQAGLSEAIASRYVSFLPIMRRLSAGCPAHFLLCSRFDGSAMDLFASPVGDRESLPVDHSLISLPGRLAWRSDSLHPPVSYLSQA